MVPVAVKTTGVIEPTLAESELAPAPEPRVHPPTVATPLAFVVCVPPVTDPPPVVTENVTDAPVTRFPFASFTMTDGAIGTAVPTGAVCASPALFVIEAAAPAVVIAVKVTGVRLPVEATRVFVPTAAPKVQLPTVATPDEFVTAAAPVIEPPPLPTLKPTATPLMASPLWSLTNTDGAVGTVAPAVPLRLVDVLAVSVVATDGVTGSPPLPPHEN
jgi:hypothetical protein